MVDLYSAPFDLDDAAVHWVEATIASMSLPEKIGQLFFFNGESRDETYLRRIVDTYHVGGSRYSPTADARAIHEQNRILQFHSKIPLFVAANTESGGDGACADGTSVGFPVKIAATGDTRFAYELGRIGNMEAAAVGCNMSFAPQVDIQYNWQAPEISTRAYSNDPVVVRAMSLAYLEGSRNATPFACTAKHFPGVGVDFRDQHLGNAVNSFSCDEWDATYGTVWQAMIDAGVEAVMPGHVMQPAYTRFFNPDIRDEDIMSACLSPELLQGLLRGKLGFNGLIISDASHMLGLTGRMARQDLVPAVIAAGCDMFLFFNDADEDFAFMVDGYRRGVITDERLSEALTRILGLKAKLGLHNPDRNTFFPAAEKIYDVVGCEEFRETAREVARRSPTLVKAKNPELLPLTPQKFPRITITTVHGLNEYYSQQLTEVAAEMAGVPKGYSARGPLAGGFLAAPEYHMKKLLEERGFRVDLLENPAEAMVRATRAGEGQSDPLSRKASVDSFVSERDLVLLLSDVGFGVQPVTRPAWPFPKGGTSIPWYVHELPVVVASLGTPYLLADVAHVQTYINAYDSEAETIEALARKLCGEEEFTGVDPVDSFCGLWDTRL